MKPKITQVTTLSQLLDVSPGLFYYILSFCGARDLSSCEQVSKTWHKVMRARVASRLWKVRSLIAVELLFFFRFFVYIRPNTLTKKNVLLIKRHCV